ncbi:superinfection immunity protein [Rhizobium sp. NRK18]|uniref:superinfection immunity protein n=1 Tax=Rhizobium sp. NRK18 TaxID=2964667 RepID=UPI0021C40346|nr:superinfection immunity protein [Rhizobium sp. NRK18]MCQ2002362.1 superinfection immunity protein [Rhizobium sp. NRK18]
MTGKHSRRFSSIAFRAAIASALIALPSGRAFAATDGGEGGLVLLALVVIAIWSAYMIPTIVAFRRGHPNRWLIGVINICFGATGIGWLGSLVWACQAVHRSPTGNHGGESGLNIAVNDPVMVKMVDEVPAAVQRADVDEIAAKLSRLKALSDQGMISAEEYARMKGNFLSNL